MNILKENKQRKRERERERDPKSFKQNQEGKTSELALE